MQVPGARGRTFRELRAPYECIEPGSRTQTAKVRLTEIGEQLAIDWGLKNPVGVAQEEAAE